MLGGGVQDLAKTVAYCTYYSTELCVRAARLYAFDSAGVGTLWILNLQDGQELLYYTNRIGTAMID